MRCSTVLRGPSVACPVIVSSRGVLRGLAEVSLGVPTVNSGPGEAVAAIRVICQAAADELGVRQQPGGEERPGAFAGSRHRRDLPVCPAVYLSVLALHQANAYLAG